MAPRCWSLGAPCRFPQPSTERIPIRVTNNLYRGFQKAQARYMRADCLNQFSTPDFRNSSQPERKSLPQNILAVSPFPSIFYPYLAESTPSNLLRMNTLRETQKKKCEPGAQPFALLCERVETTDAGGSRAANVTVGEKQVPPLRRRIRSGSGRHDKGLVVLPLRTRIHRRFIK